MNHPMTRAEFEALPFREDLLYWEHWGYYRVKGDDKIVVVWEGPTDGTNGSWSAFPVDFKEDANG
jgi:hypothetical protein